MDLKQKCKWLRNEIINILAKSKKGHVGGALSCVEILVSLYYQLLKPEDKFILSKGHVSMALYPILHDKGFISDEVYDKCYMNGNPLGGHPDTNISGVEVDSGSLGHGLGIAAGMGLANRADGKSGITYVLMGDGECSEGSVWESAIFIGSRLKINNVVAIVDNNRICATDFTANASSNCLVGERFAACGWDVKPISGNNCRRIVKTVEDWKKHGNKPLALIANTVKGIGVSYMFNNPKWHHGVPNEEQLEIARRQINGS